MTLQKFMLPAALFAMLAMGAMPVEASPQHGHGGGGSHGGGGGFHGGGGGSHGGGMAHGGGFHGHGNVGRHGGFHGDHGFHGHGQFYGHHFRHGFGSGFRFRPRFGLGFGVVLGYPFDYPYYAPLYAYPVGPLAYVVGQGYGGVAFSISPGDATVTVDGTYAGTVDQFTDPAHPLNLPPGQHRLVIQAPGYSMLDVAINVEAGRVIPYEGDLQPN